MAYRKKTQEEKDERNLRAAHTNLSASDERFNRPLHENLFLYDQALYYLRWEYFSCKDCEFIRMPEYPSWFDLCEMVKETDAWKNSTLDINAKKQAIKKARDAWTSYSAAKFDYMEHPDKYEEMPQMPNYLYRNKEHFVLTVDKTRFRGNNSNMIRIPCTDIDIKIPKTLKKEWIQEINITKSNNHPKVSFVYDYDMRETYERKQKELRGETHGSAVRTQKQKLKTNKKFEEIDWSKKRILSIDLGKVNTVTGMTYGCGKDDTSFVIRGCFI